MFRRAAAIALLVAVPAGASAQGSLFLRGARAYAEGRFADAAVAFSDAYAADPDPTYLYHLGRALEGAEDWEGALENYERFLELLPDAPERAEVEASIERVTTAIMSRREPDPDPDPDRGTGSGGTSTGRTVSHIGVREEAAGGRRISPWPWVVLGGGVVLFAVGAILGGVASGTHGSADAAPSHEETVALESEAQTQAGAATALLVIGSVVTVGGAIWGIVDLTLPVPEEGEGAEGNEALSARLRLAPTGASLELTF